MTPEALATLEQCRLEALAAPQTGASRLLHGLRRRWPRLAQQTSRPRGVVLLVALSAPPAEARRLLHGRGRRWPGLEQLTADWLEGVLLVALFREPAADQLDALRDLLRRVAASPAWQGSGAAHLLLQLSYLPG